MALCAVGRCGCRARYVARGRSPAIWGATYLVTPELLPAGLPAPGRGSACPLGRPRACVLTRRSSACSAPWSPPRSAGSLSIRNSPRHRAWAGSSSSPPSSQHRPTRNAGNARPSRHSVRHQPTAPTRSETHANHRVRSGRRRGKPSGGRGTVAWARGSAADEAEQPKHHRTRFTGHLLTSGRRRAVQHSGARMEFV